MFLLRQPPSLSATDMQASRSLLAGQVGANNLRSHLSGSKIYFHAFPATFPFRISEQTAQDFGIQLAFAFEVAVEATVREAGAGHNLADGNIVKAVPIE